jgi:hypothetical protein
MLQRHLLHLALVALGVTCSVALLAGCFGSGGGSTTSTTSTTVQQPGETGQAAAGGGESSSKHYLPSSFFDQRLSPDAPLDPQSAEMVTQLRNMAYGVNPTTAYDCSQAVMTSPSVWTPEEQQNCRPVTTRANITTTAYAPVLYTVPGDQPLVPVTLDNPNPSLTQVFAKGAPIPDDAQPATGADGQLIIWQPASNTMWEFWQARKGPDGNWQAGYGGRMIHVSRNPGHYLDLGNPGKSASASANVRESHVWGGPASSIPNLPGLMTVDQLRSGVIGHALDFATWANASGQWVYPAQRTDGRCQGAGAQYCSQIPQGARFRLDPSYDTSQLKNPIVRMIAKAVQDYGMVLNNTTGGGLTFYAEGWQQHGWQDPYNGPNGLFTHDPNPSLTTPTEFMREFPWAHLEMLKRGPTCTNESVECPQPSWWASQFSER